MVLAGLIIATIVDLAIAALLIGVSGFIMGGGPESMHSAVASAGWVAAIIICLAAPVIAFILRARGKTPAALIFAWLPPAAALVALAVPAPY